MKAFGAEVSGCRILWIVLWGVSSRIIGQGVSGTVSPSGAASAVGNSNGITVIWMAVCRAAAARDRSGNRMGVSDAGKINYEGPRLVKMAASALTEWHVAAA